MIFAQLPKLKIALDGVDRTPSNQQRSEVIANRMYSSSNISEWGRKETADEDSHNHHHEAECASPTHYFYQLHLSSRCMERRIRDYHHAAR